MSVVTDETSFFILSEDHPVTGQIFLIDELVKKDDVVLVKASRGMELEKIVEYLNK